MPTIRSVIIWFFIQTLTFEFLTRNSFGVSCKIAFYSNAGNSSRGRRSFSSPLNLPPKLYGVGHLPTPALNTADCPCTLQHFSYYFRSHPIIRSCFLLTFFLLLLPLSSSSVSNSHTQHLRKNGNNNFFAWIIYLQMTICLFDLESKHYLKYTHKYLGITFDITYFTVQNIAAKIRTTNAEKLAG